MWDDDYCEIVFLIKIFKIQCATNLANFCIIPQKYSIFIIFFNSIVQVDFQIDFQWNSAFLKTKKISPIRIFFHNFDLCHLLSIIIRHQFKNLKMISKLYWQFLQVFRCNTNLLVGKQEYCQVALFREVLRQVKLIVCKNWDKEWII